MRTSSWPRSDTGVLSCGVDVESVKAPGTLPWFWMSTVPLAESPGLRFGAVKIALAFDPLPRLLSMLRVPAVNVLAGFAALAVKFAPEPTVMPTAARTTASAPTVRRGCAARAERRDTWGVPPEEVGIGTQHRRRRTGSDPFGLTAGRCRGHDPLRQVGPGP